MSKTIIIKGKPCSGKSWMVRRIKEALNINTKHIWRDKYSYYSNGNHIYLIGKYENNTYGGLDAFHPKGLAIEMIEEIITNDKDAIIYCEGCITKVWHYDCKIYLQVDDDVLTQNLINRRRTAIAQGKTRYKELTQEEIDHKLDIFIRHDVAAKNKKYEILPHNTEEQRESNFKYLLNLSK